MNITVRQIEFRSTNGTDTIFGWIYIPAGPVRAAVQISHGMVEHMGRYHEFMRWLAQQGYAACASLISRRWNNNVLPKTYK